MKTNIPSFLLGLVAGVAVTGVTAFYLQKDYREKHADCPLDQMEVYLRTMASLTDREQRKVESIFNSASSESSYPTFTARYGAFRAIEILYDKTLRDEEKTREIARKIMELQTTLDEDSDLEWTLSERFEQARQEVTTFLSENPDVESEYKEMKIQ